jgi:RNAse (barnase) inhibitor barstar
MLYIVFEDKKKKLLEANFLELRALEIGISKYVIKLFPSDNFFDKGSFLGDQLKLNILFENKLNKLVKLNQAIVWIDSIIQHIEFIEIQCKLSFSDDFYPYNQELLNHLYKYWNGDSKVFIDRSGFTQEDLSLYLDASLLWNGVPESIEVKPRYILDGGDIRNKYELFIQIGEIFIGNKGYFGLNLDALDECLSITMKGLIKKVSLEIKNGKILSENIGSMYFESLMGILNRFFNIENIR